MMNPIINIIYFLNYINIRNISNELSNFDIINLIKDYKLDYFFGGVYSKNQLPKDLMRTKFYVINMESSNVGNGTHWVVFVRLQ